MVLAMEGCYAEMAPVSIAPREVAGQRTIRECRSHLVRCDSMIGGLYRIVPKAGPGRPSTETRGLASHHATRPRVPLGRGGARLRGVAGGVLFGELHTQLDKTSHLSYIEVMASETRSWPRRHPENRSARNYSALCFPRNAVNSSARWLASTYPFASSRGSEGRAERR